MTLLAVLIWATLIAGNPLLVALLAALIPILAKWLQDWLASRLNKSAAEMPPRDKFDSDESHAKAVLEHAIDDMPRRQRGRRLLLRFLRRKVDLRVDPNTLDTDPEFREIAEIADED